MIKILITGILLAIAAVSGNVSKALSSGDAELLGSQFNETVDLTILDDEGVYSNTQAKQILKEFFSSHPVVGYKVVHVGNAKDGSAYEIGKLSTKTKVYRTYFVLKGEGKKQKIHQFRIEDDNE